MTLPRRRLSLLILLSVGLVLLRCPSRNDSIAPGGAPTVGGVAPSEFSSPEMNEGMGDGEDREAFAGARVSPERASDGPRSTLRLRVLEEGSRPPIAGARVRPYDVHGPGQIETGVDGTCELSYPGTVLWPAFHVQKAGFVHLVTRLERKPELEVMLSRGVTLFGRILAAGSGAQVPGASLFVERSHCDCPETVVTSDFAAHYELPCVPRDEPFTAVEFQAEGFPRTRRSFELRSEGAHLEQDFFLEPGLELTAMCSISPAGVGFPKRSCAGSRRMARDVFGAGSRAERTGSRFMCASRRLATAGWMRASLARSSNATRRSSFGCRARSPSRVSCGMMREGRWPE